jgi:hypothetical protein
VFFAIEESYIRLAADDTNTPGADFYFTVRWEENLGNTVTFNMTRSIALRKAGRCYA